MLLTFFGNDGIRTTALPDRAVGQYWLTMCGSDGDNLHELSVSGTEADGEWTLRCHGKMRIALEEDAKTREYVLPRHSTTLVSLCREKESFLLYSEPSTQSRMGYRKFMLPAEGDVIIGTQAGSDITYANPHFALGSAFGALAAIHCAPPMGITVCTKRYGIYCNGRYLDPQGAAACAQSADPTMHLIKPGDELFLLGLKIVMGNGFIAVNNPDELVTMNPQRLTVYQPDGLIPRTEEELKEIEQKAGEGYSSAKRFQKKLVPQRIFVAALPRMAQAEKASLLATYGPAITMGVASLATSIFTVLNIVRSNGDILNAIPTLVMSFAMLMGSIAFPVFIGQQEKARRKKDFMIAQERYRRHLDTIKTQIENTKQEQAGILKENNPTLRQCAAAVQNRNKAVLWSRQYTDEDFLELKVGDGDRDILAEYQYPAHDDVTTELSALEKEVERIRCSPKKMQDVPITADFRKNRLVGITGDRRQAVAFGKAMAVQMATLHNYEDLKLCFVYDECERAVWEFSKWLPHAWNEDYNFRFVANDANEVQNFSGWLSGLITCRAQADSRYREAAWPHYVVFLASRALAEKAEAVKQLYKTEQNVGITLICMYNEKENIPQNCSLVIEASNRQLTLRDDAHGQSAVMVSYPVYYTKDAEPLSVAMSRIRLNSRDGEKHLPERLDFFEMYEIGRPEQLNASLRWKENDPTSSLAALIGVDASGDGFKLDIHEKAHGPHGLIAGMTGSGKSEFVISYIASMAINYSPEEVAFALIDFKGGEMAKIFAALPHLAGDVSNLDAVGVRRCNIAIEAELKRREKLFGEAGTQLGHSNINIYKYQSLYRTQQQTLQQGGSVSYKMEPIPHLIIIVDEFAELKQQYSEFLDQLISTARIGRSLGVHLILATQKPSGIVNEQMRSNMKFKICLKVQEAADSQEMLERPDAAAMRQAGRYCIRVGYDELFAMGQSGFSGAPYEPKDRPGAALNSTVGILNEQGIVLMSGEVNDWSGGEDRRKQIDAIVEYLAHTAQEENVRTRKLWQPAMPNPAAEDDENRQGSQFAADAQWRLNPVVGQYDDLPNQTYQPLVVPVTMGGNILLYGVSGSGKLAFITNLLLHVMEHHAPREAQFYLLDYDSGLLTAFTGEPHVAEISSNGDTRALGKVFDTLMFELENRKKLCMQFGGDYESYVAANPESGMANLIVVINNYQMFTESYNEREAELTRLLREGNKYGITFIVTVLASGDITMRRAACFSRIYVLHQNTQDEYSMILGRTGGLLPADNKGRGLFKLGTTVYEFQAYLPFARETSEFQAITRRVAALCKKWTQKTAQNKKDNSKRETLSVKMPSKAAAASQVVPSASAAPMARVLSAVPESIGQPQELADAGTMPLAMTQPSSKALLSLSLPRGEVPIGFDNAGKVCLLPFSEKGSRAVIVQEDVRSNSSFVEGLVEVLHGLNGQFRIFDGTGRFKGTQCDCYVQGIDLVPAVTQLRDEVKKRAAALRAGGSAEANSMIYVLMNSSEGLHKILSRDANAWIYVESLICNVANNRNVRFILLETEGDAIYGKNEIPWFRDVPITAGLSLQQQPQKSQWFGLNGKSAPVIDGYGNLICDGISSLCRLATKTV